MAVASAASKATGHIEHIEPAASAATPGMANRLRTSVSPLTRLAKILHPEPWPCAQARYDHGY